jgi:hypothetical protein
MEAAYGPGSVPDRLGDCNTPKIPFRGDGGLSPSSLYLIPWKEEKTTANGNAAAGSAGEPVSSCGPAARGRRIVRPAELCRKKVRRRQAPIGRTETTTIQNLRRTYQRPSRTGRSSEHISSEFIHPIGGHPWTTETSIAALVPPHGDDVLFRLRSSVTRHDSCPILLCRTRPLSYRLHVDDPGTYRVTDLKAPRQAKKPTQRRENEIVSSMFWPLSVSLPLPLKPLGTDLAI